MDEQWVDWSLPLVPRFSALLRSLAVGCCCSPSLTPSANLNSLDRVGSLFKGSTTNLHGPKREELKRTKEEGHNPGMPLYSNSPRLFALASLSRSRSSSSPSVSCFSWILCIQRTYSCQAVPPLCFTSSFPFTPVLAYRSS